MTTVLVTGATGFIGSKVLRRLLGARRAGQGLDVVVAGRSASAPGVASRRADLSDPESLRGLARGVDVLVHLAALVAGDEAACDAVNRHGTAALVAEAERAGVRRIVHLSTAAVYGAGPHRGITENGVAPAPLSPASRSRLAGEEAVLAAGGTVLRPGLVTGVGDRWVVPALADLLALVPARWDSGRGLLSMVDAEDLARLIAALVLAPDPVPAGVHHASHPTPVRNGDLMARLSELDILPAAPTDWSWQECLERLRSGPGGVSERQFALLATDHWYRSDGIWIAAGAAAGPGPLARLAAAAPWYRAHLHRRGGAVRAAA
ncbi:NAD(P)-dependent oxidoreductase [Streptomyces sp. 2P-4]|uniref:NAD-dependent epimerase/dehydratase family protein n=1 Tax=Streptomyces sp. 2P-4 TaxID=2931974 RepID=UPI0025421480|nr:NAD(P)-dependent oxidoreductase [Streptomyces sp. 2P-4]